MKRLYLLVFLIVALQLQAQNIITNIPGRTTFSLNGKWNYIIDPYETGYYDYRYEPYDKNPNPQGGFFWIVSNRISVS